MYGGNGLAYQVPRTLYNYPSDSLAFYNYALKIILIFVFIVYLNEKKISFYLVNLTFFLLLIYEQKLYWSSIVAVVFVLLEQKYPIQLVLSFSHSN